ncbi:MAG: hypothetical protein JO142_17130 [Burkholderiales bacterium]|nr:hypothetical protein [Burkholderiales bacterium]
MDRRFYLGATLLLTACATTSPRHDAAPEPVSPPPIDTPAPPPAAVEPAMPVAPPVEVKPAEAPEVHKPKPVANIIGNWEGRWEIESLGLEGRVIIVIDRIEGRVAIGHSSIYDTPYGELSEPFASAVFDGNRLAVKHSKSTSYTLTLAERDNAMRFAGPFTFTNSLGTFTGKLRVSKK